MSIKNPGQGTILSTDHEHVSMHLRFDGDAAGRVGPAAERISDRIVTDVLKHEAEALLAEGISQADVRIVLIQAMAHASTVTCSAGFNDAAPILRRHNLFTSIFNAGITIMARLHA